MTITKSWRPNAVLIAVLVVSGLAEAQQEPDDGVAPEMVGLWELISIVERGVDTTDKSGVIDGRELLVYDFREDGTYSVSVGGRLFESGTWQTDTTVSPMQLDHTPTESDDPTYIGHVSKGIYEVGNDVAKICIADDPPDVRPKSFDTNSCLLFILRRVMAR
jgi:uncharacterized protein (TIGR03067 family)